MTIAIGQTVPDTKLVKSTESDREAVQASDYFKGRRVAVFSVPGAFTPTCSAKHLPGYVAKIKAGVNIERPMAQLIEERNQLVEDYRELLDTDEDRATYDQLIGLAHRVFPYVEGHKFYCEHWYTNLFFNKIREFGALLRDHGFWEREEDVFHLTQYELESAIIDLMLSWGIGAAARGPSYWPAIIAQRKAAIEEWGKHTTSPALGAVPDVALNSSLH